MYSNMIIKTQLCCVKTDKNTFFTLIIDIMDAKYAPVINITKPASTHS